MSKPYLKVTSDFTKNVTDIVKKFKRDAILVGIPVDDATRKDNEPINNATLLAINEFGSPMQNIPPRPVMAIGIKNAQDEIAEQFKQGAKLALTKGIAAISIIYNRVGIIASNAVKKAINAQEGCDPPSEATLKARASHGFAGTKALVVTGQMSNAINYVVKGEE